MGFLLPARCGSCAEPGWRLCPHCAAGLRPPPTTRPPPGLDSCTSLFAYEGVARRLVAGHKFGNQRSALDLLGAAIAARAGPRLMSPAAVLTWPPTSAARRRQRGYDQAELLARAVGRAAGVRVRPLLHRDGADWTQTGHDRSARRRGPRFAPLPRGLDAHPASGGPSHGGPGGGDVVVVVDDVLTTGTTLAAAAAALRSAGAVEVHGLTLAATPAAACGPVHHRGTSGGWALA